MQSSPPNPYQTLPGASSPESRQPGVPPVDDGAPFRPRAMVVGSVVDTMATMSFQFLYVMVMLFRLGGSSGSEHEIAETLKMLPHQLTLYVAGGAMSVLGGYVAGLIARRNEVLHGLGAGVLSVILGKLMSGPDGGLPTNGAEAAMVALATPLTIASAALGGYIARVRAHAAASAG
ncbi:MAG: hypothetical protein U0610_02415 [bacterium]